jgi:hypothetical protein
VGLAGTVAAHNLGGVRSGTAAASTEVATSRTVVFNCLNRAQARPRSFVLTCADGNSYLTGLSWSNWGPSRARATGAERENGCTPNCAQGMFRSYPVRVVFWRSEPVAHHPGETYFTRITLVYPGARPPAYRGGKPVTGPETQTLALWG